jgi:hypothetical protein
LDVIFVTPAAPPEVAPASAPTPPVRTAQHRSPRERLWYYTGLVEFFERRRPGPLTEDLWRAVGELAWLVARDEAQHESPDARPPHPTRACATAARACWNLGGICTAAARDLAREPRLGLDHALGRPAARL